ncbi:MAG: GAF domain-containing protein [Verrucomicrobia bacterium]|nr:GAF domain-containing protein [Verrucomicrobiota bacterium]
MNRNDLNARYERLRLLYQVSKVIHSTLEPNQVLRLIVGEAVRVMRATSGSIALLNPTTQLLEIQAARGIPAGAARLRLRLGEGITGWVARTGRPARVGDVRSDRRYVSLRPDVRSELAVPLEVDGEIRGILNVDSDRVDAFTAADQELLGELAAQAAKVIHNTWLYEQLRLKARLFESLISVGHTINSALNLNEALQVITREASLLMEARMCSLLLLDETGQSLRLSASHGAGPAYVRKRDVGIDESLVGVVVRRKRALQELDVQTSSRYLNTDLARKEGLVSLLSVPLVFRSQAIGAINVYTAEPHLFSNEEIRILTALADLSAVAIEKARLYERVVDVEERMRRNERLSALGLLAAEVAHEIRNPLTVMKMLYHSLDLRFPEGDPRTRDAEIMGEKIEHLNRIVEQILEFARGAEPTLAPVDVNQLLQELALLTRHKLTQQNVSLRHQLETGLPGILADAGQLHQVFLNLILNAAEAMPGGGLLVIRSRLESGPAESPVRATIRIDFKDNGQGMSKDLQKRAFSSVLGSTKAKGSGLGLAIVGRIVEAHHGSIQIRSRPNHGTTITVRLPVAT